MQVGSPPITSLTPLIVRVVLRTGGERRYPLEVTNSIIPRADSYSRSVMVGFPAVADAKTAGMLSNAHIKTLRQSGRNQRQDRLLSPLHHLVSFLPS